MSEQPPRVFISYSHDSTEHAERIRALADGLRADGVDCIIDQYFPYPAEGWPRWMAREIEAADFVLMICTEIYHRRVTRNEEPGKGHGVLWESNIIYNLIYGNGTRNEKFIAVLPPDGDAEHIPTPLKTFAYHRLGGNDDQKLYDRLMKRPVQPPPLGQPKNAPTFSVSPPLSQPRAANATANPFAWRAGVTDADAFFGRRREKSEISAHLNNRQNCQIVGPRRIGKTSLLREIERTERAANVRVAFLDLQDPRCATLTGWLKRVGAAFQWASAPDSLSALVERCEADIASGRRLTLLLDQFEQFSKHPDEFTGEFFQTLRALGTTGVSVVTASRRPLSDITNPKDPTSPFFNTFALVKLDAFTEDEARAFVARARPGVVFSAEEQAEIFAFAKNHPLAVQVACFRVTEGKRAGESLAASLRRAEDEMRALSPDAWR